MLARWYLLLGQFSVTFEYRPGSLHSNADGMSRQCGQCRRPDCPVSAADLPAVEAETQSLLVDQPFASSEMGDSMDSDLLPKLSGETWVASALLEELTWDLPTVMVDCFSRWTEACPLPDKTAHSVADAFFTQAVCRFGMPIVIHSDQGREFANKIMQELCILCGSHKTRTTPYHPESAGMVERFNRTLLMMLAMFAGKNLDDWDDLLPAVMMAYRSSVHESTGFSNLGPRCVGGGL